MRNCNRNRNRCGLDERFQEITHDKRKMVNGHNGTGAVTIPVSDRSEQGKPDVLASQPDETVDNLEITGKTLGELASTVWDAVHLRPPAVFCSILGWPWTWLPPHDRFSEYKIVDLWRLRRTLRFFLNTTVPSLPMTPPPHGPPVLNNLFRHPTVVLQRPDHDGGYTSFPDEKWFFVNGIMTDDNMAQINAAYLAFLFHRPITLIQNSTDALLVDLIQCVLGKKWHHPTEPVQVAFPAIYDALTDPHKDKVVVVCHSQGTIIMADVLRLLKAITPEPVAARSAEAEFTRMAGPEFVYPEDAPQDLTDFDPLEEHQLAKLEIYAFATCADEMTYYRTPTPGTPPIPWIEHFGNENDLVARLGMLASIRISTASTSTAPAMRTPAPGAICSTPTIWPPSTVPSGPPANGAAWAGRAPFFLVNNDCLPRPSPRLFGYLNGGC